MFIKCSFKSDTKKNNEIWINPALVATVERELIDGHPEQSVLSFGTDDYTISVNEPPEYIITQSKLVAGLNIAGIGIQRVTVFTEPQPEPEKPE